MAINQNVILIYDWETSGVDKRTCLPFELGAIAVDPRSLEPIENGIFESLLGHSEEDLAQLDQKKLDEALKINGKTREQIIAAPKESVVWSEFVAFINRYNPKPGKTYMAPILAGYNIDNYDTPIFDRMAVKYGNVDSEGEPNLYNRISIDMYKVIFFWFESLKYPTRYSMNELRKFFGISDENAHTSLKDCYDTLWLMQKFMRMTRRIAELKDKKTEDFPQGQFRGAFLNAAS